MRGFKSHDTAGRFCREHGELRDLLRSRRRHNQPVSAFLPPLPVRKRRPGCARDHAERVIRQPPVTNDQNSGTSADRTTQPCRGSTNGSVKLVVEQVDIVLTAIYFPHFLSNAQTSSNPISEQKCLKSIMAI